MTIREIVEEAREAHKELLIDTCVISKVGAPVLNEETNKLEPQISPVWSGSCRVKIDNSQVAQVDPGEQIGVMFRPVLEIPANVDAVISKGFRADVSSTSPGVDAAAYTILGERAGSTSTVRRFEVEVIDRG